MTFINRDSSSSVNARGICFETQAAGGIRYLEVRPQRKGKADGLSPHVIALGALLCSGLCQAAYAGPTTSLGVNLNGWLWGNPFNSSVYFEDGFSPTGLNLSVSRGRLRADAGSMSTGWDEFGFSSRSFGGLGLTFPVGTAEATVIGGTVTTTDLLGREDSSTLFGVRGVAPLGKKFSLKASQLFSPGALFAEDRSITSIGIGYQPGRSTRLALDFARSGGGSGAQISGQTSGKRYSLSASYRTTSQNLSSIANPNLRSQRDGGGLSLSYQLAKPLSVFASTYRYSDAFGARSYNDYLGLQYTKPGFPSIRAYMQSRQEQLINFTGSNTTVPLGVESAGIGITHVLGSTVFNLGLDRFKYPGSLNSTATDSTERQLSIGIARPVGRNTFLSAQHTVSRGESSQALAKQTRSYTSFNINQRIGRKGLSVDFGIDEQGNRFGGTDNRTRSIRTGFNLPMGKQGTLGLQYRSGLSSSGLYSGDGGSLYLTYSRRVEVGRRPPVTAGYTFEQRRQLGHINGMIFEDTNNNGLWDATEPGVRDIEMAISDNNSWTGENGLFAVRDLLPGPYRLSMGLRSLPIEYAVLGPTDQNIEVPVGKTVTVNIPVVRTGQVSGTIFFDDNRNSKKDEGEKGVANAIVRVEGNETITFTDEQGAFILYNVPPKNWKVLVDTEAMAVTDILMYEGTGTGFAEVTVLPNQTTTGIELGIAEKARPVVFASLESLPAQPHEIDAVKTLPLSKIDDHALPANADESSTVEIKETQTTEAANKGLQTSKVQGAQLDYPDFTSPDPVIARSTAPSLDGIAITKVTRKLPVNRISVPQQARKSPVARPITARRNVPAKATATTTAKGPQTPQRVSVLWKPK